ncbi:MAG: hypothetical protein EPO21_13180 [Chloroflexota bacterium]|nr:MAG: hypothetical protein EPO21_13180 [Chloroflexota bacterium]
MVVDLCAPGYVQDPPVGTRIKGDPVRFFEREVAARLSDKALDARSYNAVSFEVQVSGGSPSADITIESGPAEGGSYLLVMDPRGTQPGVTNSRIFDVLIGGAWVKVRLANVTGAITVIGTPYVAPGPTSIMAVVS